MTRKPSERRSTQTFAPSPPTEKILKEFGSSADPTVVNPLIIGSSVFETEQVLRSRRVRRLSLPLYIANDDEYDLEKIGNLIHELLIFTLAEDIEINFRPLKTQKSFDYVDPQPSLGPVCLFSGGTDSYAGVLLTKKTLGDVVGVFCAHSDQARIIHIVEQLQRDILKPRGIDLIKVSVPRIEARGYAQLRGFLYLLAGTVIAQSLRSDRLIVTECGPTMYQPRFSPLDSITMTTNPFVVRTAAQVASLLLHRELKVITPFENLTKAEVVALCPDKEGLKYTHSCISQRFGTHDGTCYGCVIRRLATIAAGVEDVKYKRNPIADSRARAGNLFALLEFCYDTLTSFNEMEEYQRGIIDTYNKRDLFRRFALDNFAAVHRLLSGNKRVVRPIVEMYQNLASKLGTQVFEDRLKQLARPAVGANFRKQAI